MEHLGSRHAYAEFALEWRDDSPTLQIRWLDAIATLKNTVQGLGWGSDKNGVHERGVVTPLFHEIVLRRLRPGGLVIQMADQASKFILVERGVSFHVARWEERSEDHAYASEAFPGTWDQHLLARSPQFNSSQLALLVNERNNDSISLYPTAIVWPEHPDAVRVITNEGPILTLLLPPSRTDIIMENAHLLVMGSSYFDLDAVYHLQNVRNLGVVTRVMFSQRAQQPMIQRDIITVDQLGQRVEFSSCEKSWLMQNKPGNTLGCSFQKTKDVLLRRPGLGDGILPTGRAPDEAEIQEFLSEAAVGAYISEIILQQPELQYAIHVLRFKELLVVEHKNNLIYYTVSSRDMDARVPGHQERTRLYYLYSIARTLSTLEKLGIAYPFPDQGGYYIARSGRLPGELDLLLVGEAILLPAPACVWQFRGSSQELVQQFLPFCPQDGPGSQPTLVATIPKILEKSVDRVCLDNLLLGSPAVLLDPDYDFLMRWCLAQYLLACRYITVCKYSTPRSEWAARNAAERLSMLHFQLIYQAVIRHDSQLLAHMAPVEWVMLGRDCNDENLECYPMVPDDGNFDIIPLSVCDQARELLEQFVRLLRPHQIGCMDPRAWAVEKLVLVEQHPDGSYHPKIVWIPGLVVLGQPRYSPFLPVVVQPSPAI